MLINKLKSLYKYKIYFHISSIVGFILLFVSFNLQNYINFSEELILISLLMIFLCYLFIGDDIMDFYRINNKSNYLLNFFFILFITLFNLLIKKNLLYVSISYFFLYILLFLLFRIPNIYKRIKDLLIEPRISYCYKLIKIIHLFVIFIFISLMLIFLLLKNK
jgi:hypothetical protein